MSKARMESEKVSDPQEGNYKDIFLYNPTPMWIIDQDTLDFLEVNDAALKQYGYTRQEFLSMNAKDIRPPEYIDALIKDIEISRGSVSKSGDWYHKKKNGDIILVNIVGFPFQFNGKEARHIMATDVTEQRKIENSLKSSEARFRQIVEGAPDPIFILVDGKFVYVNERTFELFHAESESDLVSKEILDLVHSESKETVRERIRRVLSLRQPVNELVELHFLDLEGHDLYLELASQPVEHEGKDAGLVFIRDITHRRNTAKAISYQEYLLKEMGRIAKIGGWEFDPVTGDGTWTDEVARIHGLDPDDETSRDIGLSFYTEESKKLVTKAINEALTNRVPYDLELEIVLRDGTHKWVHTFGMPEIENDKVVKLKGAFQDITQRKQDEKALVESEQKYRAFFEHSLDAMILTTPDGDIIEVNQAACRLLGYKENEMKQAKRINLIDKTDRNYLPFFRKRDDNGFAVGELRFIKKDGSLIETELSSAIFFDAYDNKKASLIIRDISIRKKTEQKIIELNTELEHRIEERTAQLKSVNKDLEAFAYTVSHDLTAPVRGINGLTQILQENYTEQLDEEGLRLCSRIRANSLKMGTLIEDLLAFSKSNTSEIRREKVNMDQLVQSAISEVGEKEPLSNVEFKIDKLPPTFGDVSLLKQVWINLISNAVKFSSRKEKPLIEISGYVENDKCYYSVKDNGAGFNMQYAGKIFDAFQRLHSQQEFKGTGAGLAIVQRVILKHGGKIWADGAEGMGATFTFYLPEQGENTI